MKVLFISSRSRVPLDVNVSEHPHREEIDPMGCEDMLGQLPGDPWVAARGVTVHFGGTHNPVVPVQKRSKLLRLCNCSNCLRKFLNIGA